MSQPTLRFFDLSTVRTLPLWAQVLIAARLTKRAALAADEANTANTHRDQLLHWCDTLITACQQGSLSKPQSDAALAFANSVYPTNFITQALAHTIEAALSAQASDEFPGFDTSCITAAQSAIDTIRAQKQFGLFQVRILVAADADQLAFACSEVNINNSAALGPHVMGRLTPLHPLTIVPIPPDPESLYR